MQYTQHVVTAFGYFGSVGEPLTLQNLAHALTGCQPLLQDKLMTVTPESESSSSDNVHWIFKNKDHGKTSATASLVR